MKFLWNVLGLDTRYYPDYKEDDESILRVLWRILPFPVRIGIVIIGILFLASNLDSPLLYFIFYCALAYATYKFIDYIKRRWLENTYLPFLNVYKNFPSKYNPKYLDPKYRNDLKKDAKLMAERLLYYTSTNVLREFKLSYDRAQ